MTASNRHYWTWLLRVVEEFPDVAACVQVIDEGKEDNRAAGLYARCARLASQTGRQTNAVLGEAQQLRNWYDKTTDRSLLKLWAETRA